MAAETKPLINENPELQSYYQSLESRIGYRLVLGGTRHFGYWYGNGEPVALTHGALFLETIFPS